MDENQSKSHKEIKTSSLNHKKHKLIIEEERICKPYYKTFCFFFSLALFISSFCGVIILSITELYDNAVLRLLTLSDGGVVFDIWRTPESETAIYVYPFNYTNIDNLINEKPNVQELGPYVFKETIQKVNIVFNGNGTLTYSENRTHVFDPSSSIGDLDDVLYTPNVPFLGAAANIAGRGVFTQLTLAAVLKGLDTRPFLPVEIYDFIDGFDDSFSLMARKLSSIFKGSGPPKFGLLADRIGLAPNRVTIGTGIPDLDTFGNVFNYDGASSLDYWETEECNKITGSDGTFFPAHSIQNSSKVYLYVPGFCRKIHLVHKGYEHVVNDFLSKRYEMPEDIYSSPEENSENSCYCDRKKCQPSGTFSTSKCTFGAPVSVSFPHFLHGEEELLINVTGLSPDADQHSSYMDIHSRFGLPMGGRMRFQINVVVHHCPFLSQLNVIPDKTMLPIAWVEMRIGELEGNAKDVVYHATYTLYYLKQGFLWTSVIIMIITSLRLYLYLPQKR